jgi:hypothetical protein
VLNGDLKLTAAEARLLDQVRAAGGELDIVNGLNRAEMVTARCLWHVTKGRGYGHEVHYYVGGELGGTLRVSLKGPIVAPRRGDVPCLEVAMATTRLKEVIRA